MIAFRRPRTPREQAVGTPQATVADPAQIEEAEAREELVATIALRELNLIYQLIRLIDQAELGEQDAVRLDLLYRLDYLATRLRRSSEGLLLLAGHGIPVGREGTMSLVDIARAAAGESRDFKRVKIAGLPPLALIAGAADDTVHLLAELVDNALELSPEKAVVTVSGHAVSGGIALRVEDLGIGLPLTQIAGLNARLGQAPVIGVEATRQMGLYVVATLAHRLGALVQLQPRPGGGTCALVVIPSHLVTESPATTLPAGPVARATTARDQVAYSGGVGGDRWAQPPSPGQVAGLTAHGLPQRRRPLPQPWQPRPAAPAAKSQPADPQAVLADLNAFDAGLARALQN